MAKQTSYFEPAMTTASADRCEHSARCYTNDIISLIMSDATDRDTVVNILRKMAELVILEMGLTRGTETDIPFEHMEAVGRASAISSEMERVKQISERQARITASRYGMDSDNYKMFIDFDENAKISRRAIKNRNTPGGGPPKFLKTRISGRPASLLRISNEAIAIPEVPIALRDTDLTNDIDGNEHEEYTSRSHVVSQRVTYKKFLQRQHGSLMHRKRAMEVFTALYQVPDISHVVILADLQLTALYCIATSASIRTMIAARTHPERQREWYRLHPSKCFTFMRGLNELTELHEVGEMDDETYLASVKHLHVFNFVPVLKDAEFRALRDEPDTPPRKKKKREKQPAKPVKKNTGSIEIQEIPDFPSFEDTFAMD